MEKDTKPEAVKNTQSIGELEGMYGGHVDRLLTEARYKNILKALSNERAAAIVSLEQIEAKKCVQRLMEIFHALTSNTAEFSDDEKGALQNEMWNLESALRVLLAKLGIKSFKDMMGVEPYVRAIDTTLVTPDDWDKNAQ